jgi:ABC-type lipoprotein export system ATPase subunit
MPRWSLRRDEAAIRAESGDVSIPRSGPLPNDPRIIRANEQMAPLDSQRAAVLTDLLPRGSVHRQATGPVAPYDESIFDRFDGLASLRDGRIEGEGVPSSMLTRE